MLKRIEWNGKGDLRYVIQVGAKDEDSDEEYSELARTCDNVDEAIKYAKELLTWDNEVATNVYDTKLDKYLY